MDNNLGQLLFAIFMALVCLGLIFSILQGKIRGMFGRWLCSVMDWHPSPKQCSFDGCSFTATCPRCGRHLLQDSQGNWFTSPND